MKTSDEIISAKICNAVYDQLDPFFKRTYINTDYYGEIRKLGDTVSDPGDNLFSCSKLIQGTKCTMKQNGVLVNRQLNNLSAVMVEVNFIAKRIAREIKRDLSSKEVISFAGQVFIDGGIISFVYGYC